MSYILDALKKVEQERDLGAVPDLTTPHEVQGRQSRSSRWPWIIVTLLSVNAALVIMLLKNEDKEVADVPVTAQLAPERQTAVTSDQPAQPIPPTGEALISNAPTPEKPVPTENEPAFSAGGLVVLPESVRWVDPDLSVLPEEEPDMQMDAMTSAKDHSQLQSWYELPQEFRNRLDLPRLDVHVYSEEPRRRFIMVDGAKYREGERLTSGLVLEEILPDGMVMSYQGERFQVEK